MMMKQLPVVHYIHYQTMQNPHWMRNVELQNCYSFNVWCGIVQGKLKAHVYLTKLLTEKRFWNFYTFFSYYFKNTYPLKQCGCLAHYNRNVRQHLHEQYPNRLLEGEVYFLGRRIRLICIAQIFTYGLDCKTSFFKEIPTNRESNERIKSVIRNQQRVVTEY